MAQWSAPWPGNTYTGSPGDAGPYTADQWDNIWGILYGAGYYGYYNRGVIRNFRGELEVTIGGVNQADVDTGAALVRGKYYYNSTVVNVTIPTPLGATRIDRIVLRSDWVAQTIRVTRIVGAEGGGAPAITQTDGVTWDIPLAQVSITIFGVMTITDERDYVSDLMQRKTIQCDPVPHDGAAEIRPGAGYHTVVELNAALERASFEFVVPLDFMSLRSATLYYWSTGGTGTWDWTASMQAGGCGELYNAVSDADSAVGTAATVSIVNCLDITAAFDISPGIAAGDIVGMTLRLDGLSVITGIGIAKLILEYQ